MPDAPAPFLTVKLNTPRVWGGETIETIDFVEPRVEHVRGIKLPAEGGGLDLSPFLDIASRCSRFPPAFYSSLTISDGFDIFMALGPYVLPSLAIGGRASRA